MGSRERREREKSEQRQKILNAALQIITKEGFAALSMRKLAERIEYSAASIYLYFTNREQIARELSEIGFEDLLNAFELARSGREGVEALHALGAAYVLFGLRHPEMYRLIFMGDSDYMTAVYAERSPESAAARVYGVVLELARQLKNAGIASKQTKVALIAETIWCSLHGIVSLRITCAASQSSSPEALVRFATETLARGLNCTQAKASKKSARPHGREN